jgi:hypothetical protein
MKAKFFVLFVLLVPLRMHMPQAFSPIFLSYLASQIGLVDTSHLLNGFLRPREPLTHRFLKWPRFLDDIALVLLGLGLEYGFCISYPHSAVSFQDSESAVDTKIRLLRKE